MKGPGIGTVLLLGVVAYLAYSTGRKRQRLASPIRTRTDQANDVPLIVDEKPPCPAWMPGWMRASQIYPCTYKE